MSEINVAAVERIVANTIVETARGDPIALASRIVAALADAGYRISPVNEAEDTALGRQPFDELTSEMRPQDTYGDGRGWTFRTGEHGGDGFESQVVHNRCGALGAWGWRPGAPGLGFVSGRAAGEGTSADVPGRVGDSVMSDERRGAREGRFA